MSADAHAIRAGETTDDSPVRALVYTSPTHELADGRGTFSPTTSTLLVGRAEAVLIDAQYIRSDVAALGDLIEETGRSLTSIYITHGHADHYFGIGQLLERFPGARPLATAGVLQYIEETLELQRGQWQAMFGEAAVSPTVLPQALNKDAIELEEMKLRVIEIGQGDILPSTVVHVPAIDTVVAGDVVYNGIHPMLGLSGPEGWANWIESINRVEELEASTIIAGHKTPDASDQAVTAMIQGTRSYIADFATAAARASDARELIGLMLDKYGDLGNPWTLKFSAHAWFSRDNG